MKLLVVGGGKVGEALSRVLARERHDVVLIEKNETLAEELAERLDALVLQGDGSDAGVLRDANAESSDVVVAATSDDKANLAACEFARNAKVPVVISRINHAASEKDFSKAGIEKTIDATAAAVLAFRKAMDRPGKPLVGLTAGGKAEIFEVSVRKGSKAEGRTVADAAKDFSVACIYRDDKVVLPKPDTKLREGDILTIAVPLEDARKLDGVF